MPAHCTDCWHWTRPLKFIGHQLLSGQLVAMRFEDWIIFNWHVHVHQSLHDVTTRNAEGGEHSAPSGDPTCQSSSS